MRTAKILMMALFVASVAACGGDDDSTAADAAAGNPDGSGGGAVTVAAVANPTTLAAGDSTELTLTFTGDFTLTDPGPTGGTTVDGQGHYHIYLDNATGGDYLVNDFVNPVTVLIPTGTAAGTHTLHVVLEGNDHMPLTPNVQTDVEITVQ